MELRQLWKVARRWWWLIVLPALVVAAYSAVTYRAPAPSYGLTLRFTAGQPEAAPQPGYYGPYYQWLASEYIVGALKDWVRTGDFAERVSAVLQARGLALPPAAVAGAITASDNQRSLLLVFLGGGDPAQLTAIAEAATMVLREQNGAVFPQLNGEAATVTPLDTPNVGAQPPGVRSLLDLPLRLALALAFGAALALAAHYLDPYVREKSELEKLGWKVVAEIPRREVESRK
jgi:capsular polysaccharide biosynthesis protein